jgi:PPK2 family polyphosphate:nucleotide phosphotransferase
MPTKSRSSSADAVVKPAELIKALRVEPGKSANLAKRDSNDYLGFESKAAGLERLGVLVSRIGMLHDRLAAEGQRSLLLVLQGLDASGKDGTVRHVLTGVSPQAWRIVSFKVPTTAELAHDYLWRVHDACPARGEVGIFNRSHYEDLVTARVRALVPEQVWKRRPRQVREFERTLSEEGTAIIKVFLHVSADEQRIRLEERLSNPEKAWKFSLEDLADRERRDDYLEAYEEVITETSTDWAPWHVVPADHNWVRNLAVAELLAHALEQLDPKLPPADPAVAGLHIP